VVLLDESALLERREQSRRGRLVEAELSRELRDPRLPVALAQREQQGGRSIDRADRVAVQRHPALPRPRQPCCAWLAPLCAVALPCARASSAAFSESSKAVTTRSTMSPSLCASHMNQGSRLSGSGITPRACMPTAIAS